MKNKTRLLVVAHPDDETIFFSTVLLQKRDRPWRVICVTDGNGDGRRAERRREFAAAMKAFNVTQFDHWELPDIFSKRLSLKELCSQLTSLGEHSEIFTHGPLGEYGHPHHQDVSLAVHLSFPKAKILCPAWNSSSSVSFSLTENQLKKKQRLFTHLYAKEISRFINILPCQNVEPFESYSLQEVDGLVRFFRREISLQKIKLEKYEWMRPQLMKLRSRLEKRLF